MEKRRYRVSGVARSLHRDIPVFRDPVVEYRWAKSEKQARRLVEEQLRKDNPRLAFFLDNCVVEEETPPTPEDRGQQALFGAEAF